MKPRVQRMYDRHYPVLKDGTRLGDGSSTFYHWIRSTPGLAQATVFNVGAGPTPGPGLRRLRGEVGRLVGVDIDPIVHSNQDLDEAYVTDGAALPSLTASSTSFTQTGRSSTSRNLFLSCLKCDGC